VASIAGTLVAADGRSPFTTALLALDAQLVLIPDEEVVGLGDFLPLRSDWLQGRLIAAVRFQKNIKLGYDYVARSPADQPIVCVAVCIWPSGRTRVALGGFGEAPMVVFDGAESSGAEAAANNAYSIANDEWASSDYRQEIASILTARILSRLASEE
jgi:CO/xanthine dehydrogenase FAD-binding subunit